MTKLSVNINKLATLRNARGNNLPNLSEWVPKIQAWGAQGITVHPRPDERHIKYEDVFALKPLVTTEYNIEGYPSETFLKLISDVEPDQCTLVPDPPEVLTSNAGWRVSEQTKILAQALKNINLSKTRVSVFIDPNNINKTDTLLLKDLGVQRAELYTESFANNPYEKVILEKYRKASDLILDADIELNAGHDLNLENLNLLLKNIPEIKEVSIGHALICESLEQGMKQTIESYRKILNEAQFT